jgi:hypothetical protein
MSKKKNTLKDLDEFLKQQAATLVSPVKLSEKIEAPPPPPAQKRSVEKEHTETQGDLSVSAAKILSDLLSLAEKEGQGFRDQFYDLIIRSTEAQGRYSPEDRMLINTALYLKNGDRWKDEIREYWRKKNSHQ